MAHQYFSALSEILEWALSDIESAQYSARDGDQKGAQHLLREMGENAVWKGPLSWQLGAALVAESTQLACVAEGETTAAFVNGNPHYYTSAHHAIFDRCSLLAWLTHRRKAGATPPDLSLLQLNTSLLRSQLLRERAKLLDRQTNRAGSPQQQRESTAMISERKGAEGSAMPWEEELAWTEPTAQVAHCLRLMFDRPKGATWDEFARAARGTTDVNDY